jgi:acetolactate synthase-1/2/3 large subunit
MPVTIFVAPGPDVAKHTPTLLVEHSYVIRDVKKIAHIISEAFFIARNGRPGPVLIDIPKDVGLEEFTNYKPVHQNHIIKSKGFRFIYKSIIQRLYQTIHFIEQASQPLLYIGGGVIQRMLITNSQN